MSSVNSVVASLHGGGGAVEDTVPADVCPPDALIIKWKFVVALIIQHQYSFLRFSWMSFFGSLHIASKCHPMCGCDLNDIKVLFFDLNDVSKLTMLMLLEIMDSLSLNKLLLIYIIAAIFLIKVVLMLISKYLEFEAEFEISGSFWFFAIFLRRIQKERKRECSCFSCTSCNDENNRSKSPNEIIGSFSFPYWILTLCLVLIHCAVITWNMIELQMNYIQNIIVYGT